VRDIRFDLHERINLLRQQISSEQAQFESQIAQLRKEQETWLEDLNAQLRAVTRLREIATWQHNVRMVVARALAVAATIEISAATAVHQLSQEPMTQGGSRVHIDGLPTAEHVPPMPDTTVSVL